MRLFYIVLLTGFLSSHAMAQNTKSTIDGEWVFTMVGDPTPQRVNLVSEEDSVSGRVYGYPFTGTIKNVTLKFEVGSYKWSGTLSGDKLTGWIVTNGDSSRWSGQRYQNPSSPRSFDHVPKEYHRLLSAEVEPALRIFAGDTVRTTTVDAGGWSTGGYRESGNRITEGGNPLSGPFYVEGTLPGDVLAVELIEVRLNRNWAYSGDAVMSSVLDASYIREREIEGNLVIWDLDPESGMASIREPSKALQNYQIELTPFLGSIAVAPGQGVTPSSRDSGPFGGNMEYIEMKEGATVYLPVGEEGAFLYLGDGHAVQGDGELTGDALETSMDVTFKVDVLKYRFHRVPRVETDQDIASIGIAGSIDLALEKATSDLARWLENDYGLSSTESAIIMGTAIEYDITDIVLPWLGVAARINKEVLARVRPKE